MGLFSGAGVSTDAPELLTSRGWWLVVGDLLPQPLHLSSLILPALSPELRQSTRGMGPADGASRKATPVSLWSQLAELS